MEHDADHDPNSHFVVGSIESARERFKRVAAIALKTFDVEKLNLQAYQMATWLDVHTGNYSIRNAISTELDVERERRDRRRGMSLLKPIKKGGEQGAEGTQVKSTGDFRPV
jgi:hypothetical protein